MREFRHLSKVFIANGYPQVKVRKFFSEKAADSLSQRAKATEVEEEKPRAYLPFWGRMSLTLKALLSAYGFQVAFTSTANLDATVFKRTLQHTKPPMLAGTSFQDRQNVVYRIKCDGCDSAYVGCTKRLFSTRLKEHRHDTGRHTGLTEHASSTGHGFQLEQYLYCSPRESHLRFVEALHIAAQTSGDRSTVHNTLLNKQTDPRTRTLPPPWNAILHHFV
jgi:hypothetical protein